MHICVKQAACVTQRDEGKGIDVEAKGGKNENSLSLSLMQVSLEKGVALEKKVQ